MPFVTVLTRDREADQAIWHALRHDHLVARIATWSRLVGFVRERPVTCVVLDGGALPREEPEQALVELMRLYPSLATVLVARDGMDRRLLFRLGRAGLDGLVLLPLDGLVAQLPRAVRQALAGSTDAVVTRIVSPSLSRRETRALRLAMEAVERGWATEEVADRAGLTRPHLSVLLRGRGLPSLGHLLTWARMLHAGRWLTDPGRTGESVSRQLDYSSGAAFRRALRNYVGATPTQVAEGGGLRPVLERFVEACDLELPPRALRSVA